MEELYKNGSSGKGVWSSTCKIYPAEDRDKWRALVNKIMKHFFHKSRQNLLSS
jgi:hypothetical protein